MGATDLEQLTQLVQQAAAKGKSVQLSPEETAILADALQELTVKPNFAGEGKTLGEIMASDGFGGWEYRQDIEDSALYAAKLHHHAEKRS